MDDNALLAARTEDIVLPTVVPPAWGTRIFNLTIRVHEADAPLFNRVVSFRQRNCPGVPRNTVQLVYRCIYVDWWALAVTNGQVAGETVSDMWQDEIYAHMVSVEGDSSAELTPEEDPL
jgi:hypothetical protein